MLKQHLLPGKIVLDTSADALMLFAEMYQPYLLLQCKGTADVSAFLSVFMETRHNR